MYNLDANSNHENSIVRMTVLKTGFSPRHRCIYMSDSFFNIKLRKMNCRVKYDPDYLQTKKSRKLLLHKFDEIENSG